MIDVVDNTIRCLNNRGQVYKNKWILFPIVSRMASWLGLVKKWREWTRAWKYGGWKTHGPLLLFGTKLSDPPLLKMKL